MKTKAVSREGDTLPTLRNAIEAGTWLVGPRELIT